MSNKLRSMTREIARRGGIINFAECLPDDTIEQLEEERHLCPKCRAAMKAAKDREHTVAESTEISDT